MTKIFKDKTPIVLCLSGGGFRATFFHLGVIRYLRDVGMLSQVSSIFSVSGGSIIAAHLALNWDQYSIEAPNPGRFLARSAEVAQFAMSDVRGHIQRQWMALGYLPAWQKTRLLERAYSALFHNANLSHLPAAPHLEILATSLVSGKVVGFSREGVRIGTTSSDMELHSVAGLPLAKAVAASSAFPPMFPPVELNRGDLNASVADFPVAEFLTDGGVYDNLGLEAALSATPNTSHAWTIVSDASAQFDLKYERWWALPRNARAFDIAMRRASRLQQDRTQSESHNVTVLPISSVSPANLGQGSRFDFSPQDIDIQRLVPKIRTDLDRFSVAEITALTRHGYEVALALLPSSSAARSITEPCPPRWPQGGASALSLSTDLSRLQGGLARAAQTLRMTRDALSAAEDQLYTTDDEVLRQQRIRADLAREQQSERLRQLLSDASLRSLGLFNCRDPASWILVVEMVAVLLLAVLIGTSLLHVVSG